VDKYIKEICFILVVSVFLGILRFMFVDDPTFTLIKYRRELKELGPSINDKGQRIFALPEFMTEPMVVDLEFTKFLNNNNGVIIDARDPEDYESGHIINAVNIPFNFYDDYTDLIDSLDYKGIYIVYCGGGDCSLSIDLADILFNEKLFENVFIFEGGFPEWKSAGLPIQ